MNAMSLTRDTADEFRNRINQLTPESERIFGKMDVAQMMRHMRLSLDTATGKETVPDKSTPVVRNVLFFLTCHVMTTWPGGKIKAPDYWNPPAEHEFDEERRLLLDAIDPFLDKLEQDPAFVTSNPVLGPLNQKKWSRLLGIHFKHHLRQFSIT